MRLKSNQEIRDKTTFPKDFKKSEEYILKVIELVKERCTFFEDVIKESNYLFSAPDDYNSVAVEKKWTKETVSHLISLKSKFMSCKDFTKNKIEIIFKDYLELSQVGFGQVMPGLRISITGKMQGPSMISVMELLGLHEVISRIDKAIETLGNG